MKDLYYVAVKLFLRDGNRLLIMKDAFGDWDLPGGRVRRNEFRTSFEKVLARKVREELGNVRYRLAGGPIVFFRHERREEDLPGQPKVRIFALGYEAKFSGGKLKLSRMHTEYKWVAINKFRPERFFHGGWLKGVKEYLQLKARV